jgi:hypothetical protein
MSIRIIIPYIIHYHHSVSFNKAFRRLDYVLGLLSPETGNISVDGAQLTTYHLKTETESNLQNVMFYIKINRRAIFTIIITVLIYHCHRFIDLLLCYDTCPQQNSVHKQHGLSFKWAWHMTFVVISATDTSLQLAWTYCICVLLSTLI